MSHVTLLAIDLAKNIFQLHGADARGKPILKKRVRRDQLLEVIAQIKPCDIYMEGCGSANYWGRQFQNLGHRVKLINPKYVKPYVQRNKNDEKDAAAIASCARDPVMRFGDVKTEAQQDVQSTHRIRSLLISQRTALANQIRGIVAEYGVIIPKGIRYIGEKLPVILENEGNHFSAVMLENLVELYENFVYLNQKIAQYDEKIGRLFKSSEICQRLAKIPGVGKLGATILAAVLGNGAGFKNGRHFAAFLGLVPKQQSSGEKHRLLGISKGGDTYIRTLLIHGGRSALLWSSKKKDPQSDWLNRLRERAGYNVAAVAMANKIARIAWAVVKGQRDYDPHYLPCLSTAPASKRATAPMSARALARSEP